MKELWVRADGKDDWNTRKKRVTNALESGVGTVWVNPGEEDKTRQLGSLRVVSDGEKADLKVGKDVSYTVIKDKESEQEVVKAGKSFEYVVFRASDWKVIPLENIIAALQKEKARIIVEVDSFEEAKTVLETLEVGADGVLVEADRKTLNRIKDYIDSISQEKVEVSAATVTDVRQVGMGDRVCVDTASMFALGEGMLVGSQSNGLFLVHSETLETEYVASRPFRVNAGPVHAYTMVPGGKTKYLSDLKAGDEVLAVNKDGNTRTLIIGRLKIEKRPLILVEAEKEGKVIKSLLQNAETINLVDEKGKAVSVVKVKKGDKLLAHVEEGGRHFGMKVDESIEEK
ncbi:MAG: 3-dehydroquinate synthase II [Candidatus Altiarchaeales archaeon]|nr:3-dehydroquinate synthase II [Candidatus Altiarchaeales archaeon]MBD3415714.1 3-dehydroquinate synthase II [Candidatus Altiarchaeales archaeon]